MPHEHTLKFSGKSRSKETYTVVCSGCKQEWRYFSWVPKKAALAGTVESRGFANRRKIYRRQY